MNYVYIQPRQTGKTTIAVAKFLENPKKSLIMVVNNRMAEFIQRKIPSKYWNRIISSNIDYDFRGTNIIRELENLIIDDYLCMDTKKVYDSFRRMDLWPTNNVKFFTYTTSNNLYDKYFYDFVKKCKEERINCSYINFRNFKGGNTYISEKEFEKQVNLLYHNLITEPNTKLIFYGEFPGNKMDTEINIGSERAEIEIYGKLFKEKLNIAQSIDDFIELQKLLKGLMYEKVNMSNIEEVQFDITIQPKISYRDVNTIFGTKNFDWS